MNQPYQQQMPQQQFVPQQQGFPQQQPVPQQGFQLQQPEPTWVRIPKLPPEHIQYAHRMGRGMLTLEQIDELVKAINQFYVMKKQGQNTYLSQHQARAEMNRIFGYGNWASHVRSMDLEYEERMHKDDMPRHPNFPKTGKAEVYWISCYKASVEVQIRDLWGMPVTSFTEYHVEENAPQPNRGEARALAATSVESYALRRALIGLGDRFGLGLYNGGSMAAHGQYTIQQLDGQVFDWVAHGPDGKPLQIVAAPAPQLAITHESLVTQTIGDDVVAEEYVEQAPQQPQQAPQQQYAQGGMAEFHQAQEQMQQGREQARAAAAPVQQQMPQQAYDPNILARLQGGLKTNQEGA